MADARLTYDAMATSYDAHLLDACRYRSPQRLAQTLDKLGSNGLWLDLGAGTGMLGDAVASLRLPIRMHALDVSQQMLDQITCPLYERAYRCDVLARIPGRSRFDGAMASGLLEYVLDVPRLFRRVASHLSPGGMFMFTFVPSRGRGDVVAFDPDGDLHAHHPQFVRDSLVTAGFADCSVGPAFCAYRNGEMGWIRHRIVAACTREVSR